MRARASLALRAGYGNAAMSETASSVIVGTAGLTLAFLVSLVLAIQRPPLAREYALHLRSIAALSVAAQFLHFMEELANQFYVRFPELLGLTAWPATFFVVLNLSSVVVGILGIVLIRRLASATRTQTTSRAAT